MKTLQPSSWPQPKGYANGVVVGPGETIFLAGIVGWNKDESFESDDFVAQLKQALGNCVALLAEAKAGPEHVVRMTWYITDKAEYLNRLKEVGDAYRDIMGKHFPAMACVEVSELMEDRALIEIETTAVIEAR